MDIQVIGEILLKLLYAFTGGVFIWLACDAFKKGNYFIFGLNLCIAICGLIDYFVRMFKII